MLGEIVKNIVGPPWISDTVVEVETDGKSAQIGANRLEEREVTSTRGLEILNRNRPFSKMW
jgi:hypothetical protein